MSRVFVFGIIFISSFFEKTACDLVSTNSYLCQLNSSYSLCTEYNNLNIKIRDGKIEKSVAQREMQILLPKLKIYYFQHRGKIIPQSDWVFPVQGYDFRAVGGKNGNGYTDVGYDFFDGNKHLAHPAQDIFIMDRNQDNFEDISKKRVNVLSVSGGIVIAKENNWDSTSDLRGGKFIWIYDPTFNSLFYYAHNSRILVALCQIINPGDTIATIGRSGLSAFKKRSPTHLHFMQLNLDGVYHPKPINCYQKLRYSRTKL